MGFTLHDLGLAFRKAKVDIYYSSHASLFAIAEYEKELANNLQSLMEKLNGADEDWVRAPSFLGGWTLAPKGVSCNGKKAYCEDNGTLPIFSSPEEEWENLCALLDNDKDKKYERPEAEFRLMARCSLDFHVLSSLWLLKVGHIYDEKLGDCAFGSRLRRGLNEKVNPLSLGSFRPYLKPFRDWRDGGIDAMRRALSAKKRVVSLTADVSSFYHELNPGFMVDEKFKKLLELGLSPEQEKLNRLFIQALESWAQSTPLKKGLPVGLPASAVVANVALVELDRLIEQQVAPLYYGRYVDDILLVMENGANFRSSKTLWEWLFDRADGMLGWVEGKKEQIQFKPDYLGDSKVRFANQKNKVFLLEGETGLTLVDSIAHQIHERASEWRSLPNLPLSATHVATDLVAATQHDGEIADNLRKTDALTMRRAGFAIKLRDFEAYERDLQPDAWKEHRKAFFRAFCQHVLVLPHFFELAIYLPRVVKLATACEDFESLRKIIQRLEHIYQTVEKTCRPTIKACTVEQKVDEPGILARWKSQLDLTLDESIISAFPPHLSKTGKVAWQAHIVEAGIQIGGLPVKSLQSQQALLFSFDLAHQPFRVIGLPKEMVSQRGVPAKKSVTVLGAPQLLLPPELVTGTATLSSWIRFTQGLPHGLLFATRPFNLAELFVIAREPFAEASHAALKEVVLALRGFTLDDKTPSFDKKGVLQIPDGEGQQTVGITVSSWKTELQSWVASIMRTPDPDAKRYARLNKLVNSVISGPKRSRYFVLPELALPAHWFMRIALKLQARGISLITGVEYLHASRSRVRNQVWAALSHDGLGFPSTMIYRQDKQRPALHEEQELQRLAGLELRPDRHWPKPPIVQHGRFRFALLVCSELTNIGYRAALRGQVDALFVPEWNQDTETFNALVESAALDIHAYIVQCNDRQYGDSRIRAPSKDSWLRDVLRVKGGTDDYSVTGVIDIEALRAFQSSYRSPCGEFKPVPDGFEIAFERRVLPKA